MHQTKRVPNLVNSRALEIPRVVPDDNRRGGPCKPIVEVNVGSTSSRTVVRIGQHTRSQLGGRAKPRTMSAGSWSTRVKRSGLTFDHSSNADRISCSTTSRGKSSV